MKIACKTRARVVGDARVTEREKGSARARVCVCMHVLLLMKRAKERREKDERREEARMMRQECAREGSEELQE